MTSNLGADAIMNGIKEDGTLSNEAIEQVQKMLKMQFRPEFLNRLDEIIFFKPLTKTEIVSIVDLLLKGLENRLQDRQITLKVTDKAKQFIVDNGYDVAFGARPLKRFIQNNVETLIAKYMLANDFLLILTVIWGSWVRNNITNVVNSC